MKKGVKLLLWSTGYKEQLVVAVGLRNMSIMRIFFQIEICFLNLASADEQVRAADLRLKAERTEPLSVLKLILL